MTGLIMFEGMKPSAGASAGAGAGTGTGVADATVASATDDSARGATRMALREFRYEGGSLDVKEE